ncbi:PorV/PorQ family protein [bacterium]|nr:PorV/PorQ family protein [bacterium]
MPYQMKKLASLSFLICSCFFAFNAHAQQARIYSNEFLSIGLGARAQGMGNSYVATTNDVYSLYWNPAGLVEMKGDMQVAYKHAEYFAGIANYDFGGIAIRNKDSSTLAFGVIRFGVDDIPNTLYLIEPDGTVNFDNVTLFSVADYAFYGSYGRKVGKFQLGGSAKVIHRTVGPFANSWGFGLDFGAKYHLGKSFTLGALARDVTSTFNAWTMTLDDDTKAAFTNAGQEIPKNSIEITLPKLLVGINYHHNFSDKISLQSELGFNTTFDGKRNTLLSSKFATIDPHFGFEVGLKNLFFLRAGVGNIQKETIFDPSQSGKVTTFQPNVGAGFNLKYFSIDYAYTDIGDNSGAPYSHLISMRFDLSKELFRKNIEADVEAE